MIDPAHPTARRLCDDGRYSLQAYNFLLEAMEFARDQLGMGKEAESELPPGESAAKIAARTMGEKHVSGQQLCEAIRLFALHEFGHMARCVFRQWGVNATGDFGEMVFRMIDLNLMLKTPDDRREDFNDVYDVDDGLQFDFRRAMKDVELAY